jgi:hypothetical protein
VNLSLFARSGALSSVMLLSACCFFPSYRHKTDTIPPTTGSLSVAPASEFAYLPAQAGQLSPNRIQNTAVSSITLKRNVDASVRDAVARTLTRAGVDTADTARILSARIEAFSVEDARSPAWWTLKMHYVLIEADTKRELYASTKTVRRQFHTFTNNTIALEDTVAANVSALLVDPDFVRVLH